MTVPVAARLSILGVRILLPKAPMSAQPRSSATTSRKFGGDTVFESPAAASTFGAVSDMTKVRQAKLTKTKQRQAQQINAQQIKATQSKFSIGFVMSQKPSLHIKTVLAIRCKNAKLVRRKRPATASLLQSLRNETKGGDIDTPGILRNSG